MQSANHRSVSIVFVIGLLFCYVISSPASAAEIPFGSQTDIVTSANTVDFPIDVVVGDFNSDQKDDLVMCAESSGQVWLHYGGNVSGSTIATALDSPRSVDVGDIDGDGDTDVIIGQYNNIAPGGQAEILWYERLENGTWAAHDVYSLSYTGVRSIKLADMDLDGDLDYVLAAEGDPDQAYSSLSWRENMLSDTGTAEFSGGHHTLNATCQRPWDVEVADIDGDGDPDIVAADVGLDQVAWYENDGTPIAGWTEHILTTSFDGAVSVAIGDIDEDGYLDIVAAGISEDQILWFENGSWTSHNIVLGIDSPSSVELADLDFDGDLDIVVTRETAGGEVLWIENKEGSLWQRRSVDTSFGESYDAVPADLDGDGDFDIAAVGYTTDKLSWWENENTHRRFAEIDPITIWDGLNDPRATATGDINGDGLMDVVLGGWGDSWVKVYLQVNETAWWENTVDTGTNQFRDIAVADMDHDGDLDILGASLDSDSVYWWANGGGALPSWTRHTILSSFDGAHAVEPVDLDGDGDLDVVVTAFNDDESTIVINDNGAGTTWTKKNFTPLDGAYEVAVGDLNGDGRPDFVASGYYEDVIRVDLQGETLWGFSDISGLDGPRGVSLGDIDGDGDLDIVGAIRDDDDILWFENDGDGGTWTSHDVGSGYLNGGSSVQAVDVDHDGDIDVVGTGYGGDDVYLWTNDGDGSSWTRRKIETSLDSPWQAVVEDINGDNNMDLVLTAAGTTDSLTWYKNVGAQFLALAYDYAPSYLLESEKDSVFNFIVGNNGRSAADHSLEISGIQLYFEDTQGDPLTSVEVNNIIERMEIYLDADDDLIWIEGADTLLATDLYLSTSGGTLNFSLAHDSAGNEVAPGNAEGFFIVLRATSDATEQTPQDIRITFKSDELECRDRSAETPLIGEPAEDVTTKTITFGSQLFSDGFESNDLSAWDASAG